MIRWFTWGGRRFAGLGELRIAVNVSGRRFCGLPSTKALLYLQRALKTFGTHCWRKMGGHAHGEFVPNFSSLEACGLSHGTWLPQQPEG